MDSNIHHLAIRYISPHTCHPTVTQTASFDGSQRRLTLSLSAQQRASRTEADTRGLLGQRSRPASHVLDGSEREEHEEEEKEKNEEDEQGGRECDTSDRDYETDLESTGINTVVFRIEKSEIAVPVIPVMSFYNWNYTFYNSPKYFNSKSWFNPDQNWH